MMMRRTHVTYSPPLSTLEFTSLQILYNQTNGPAWTWINITTFSVPWNFSIPHANPCKDNWEGILCTCSVKVCNIKVLTLPSHNMNGTLPQSIENFHKLQILDLSNNMLNGSIPSVIGNLLLLQVLQLNFNLFTGLVPISLQALHNLQVLDLSGNFLKGHIPMELYTLANLQSLILSSNYLSGPISNNISYLSALMVLEMPFNRFTSTLPSGIGNLSNLRTLDLSSNYFTGCFPSSLFSLSNLTGLTIQGTTMTCLSLPNTFDSLVSLTSLDISRNHFYGSIPDSIGRLTKLEYLLLDNCHLLSGSIPSTFEQLVNLKVLFLDFNLLTGSIPFIANSFNQLALLYLHGNFFTGPYPISTQQFQSLQFVDLSDNFFTGPFPWYDDRNSSLKIYECYENAFTGFLPQNSSALKGLLYFVISNNYLQGSLASTFLSQANHLQFFAMGNNWLTGSIPMTLGEKTSMSQLVLTNNFFTGTIPASLSQMTQLTVLQLNGNQLIGTLPDSFQEFQYLEQLYVQENQLTGDINTFFNQTRSAKYYSNIDISKNQFTGTLPTAFFLNAKKLYTFAAASNCITGSIPSAICHLPLLESLALDGLSTSVNCRLPIFSHLPAFTGFTVQHYLDGSIPTCLFEMEKLQTLHLSGNGLIGTIPDCSLRNTSKPVQNQSSLLTDLSLSHNLLTGTIPLSIQQHSWQNLDLSYNKLMGTLTASLTISSSLSLQVNRLSGDIPTSILNLQDISILEGNIFQCNELTGEGLPKSDSNYATYSCGSDAIDNVLYTWIIVICLVPLLFVFLFSGKRQVTESSRSWQWMFERIKEPIKLYREALVLKQRELRSLSRLSSYFRELRAFMSLIIVFVLILLVPVYFSLKHWYSSYTIEYTYALSGLLLTGETAATVLFLILSLFAGVFLFFLNFFYQKIDLCDEIKQKEMEKRRESSSTTVTQDSGQRDSVTEKKRLVYDPTAYLLPDRREAVAVYLIVGLLDLAIMSVSDFCYVYIVLTFSGFAGLFAAFSLALFRIATNNLLLWSALPSITHMLRYFCSSPSSSSTLDRSDSISSQWTLQSQFSFFFFPEVFSTRLLYTSRDLSYLENLILFNNIVIPGLAILFILPDCFYTALFTPNDVQSSYQYQTCNQFLAQEGVGHNCILNTQTTSYTPPFLYSYQCSSKIVLNYVPVYILVFLLTGLVIPGLKWGMKWLYEALSRQEEKGEEKDEERRGKETLPVLVVDGSSEQEKNPKRMDRKTRLFWRKKAILLLRKLLPPYFKPLRPVHYYTSHSQASPFSRMIPEASFPSSSSSISSLPSKGITEIGPLEDPEQPSTRVMKRPFPRLFSKLTLTVQINSSLTILLCFGVLFPPLAIIAAISICSMTFFEELTVGWLLVKTRALGADYQWYEEEINKEYKGVEESSRLTVWSTLIVSCTLYGYIIFDTMGDSKGWSASLPLTLAMMSFPLCLFLIFTAGRYYFSPKEKKIEKLSETAAMDMTNEVEKNENKVRSDGVAVEMTRVQSVDCDEIQNPMQVREG